MSRSGARVGKAVRKHRKVLRTSTSSKSTRPSHQNKNRQQPFWITLWLVIGRVREVRGPEVEFKLRCQLRIRQTLMKKSDRENNLLELPSRLALWRSSTGLGPFQSVWGASVWTQAATNTARAYMKTIRLAKKSKQIKPFSSIKEVSSVQEWTVQTTVEAITTLRAGWEEYLDLK